MNIDRYFIKISGVGLQLYKEKNLVQYEVSQ